MPTNNNLLKQLLENSQKLLEAYRRTKDESILSIVENMIQLMLEEVNKEEDLPKKETTWIEDLLKQARELDIPVCPGPIKLPPADFGGVYVYAAPGLDMMGPAAYAAPPIISTGGGKLVQTWVSDSTDTDTYETE